MRKFSFWRLGFRPFFLLGALHACVAVIIWIAFLSGWIARPGYLDPILWHSQEMIFGFALAIIAGFVLTAAQNWTGIRGLHGRPLQLLVLVWVLGRVLLSVPGVPEPLAALVDLSFIPLVAAFLVRYLKDPGFKAERVFFLIFGLMFAGNLLVHLEGLGIVPGYGRSGILLSLGTVILVIVFMGGRVIPFFTESELSCKQPRTWLWVERSSFASMAVFLILQFLAPLSLAFGITSIATALIHLLRLYGWQVKRVRRVPLIWVLHIAYLWLVIAFFLSSLSAFGLLLPSLAIHAFTVGGIGIVIYGMTSRVALGHTGRRLHPSAWTVSGYHLLNAGAVVRVFCPLIFPTFYLAVLGVTSLLWVSAFTVFIFVYAPMLVAPRLDGRPG